MVIKTEISSFDEFQAWSGGKDTLEGLDNEQKEDLFKYAEEVFDGECTETELNDWLWFETESIYEHLGLDKYGRKIGSVDWAREILGDYANEKYFVNQFGNPQNILSCYLDEEYNDGDCDDEDELKCEFDCYLLEKWREFMVQQLQAWHSDYGIELIKEWLEENYDDAEMIPDTDEVDSAFSEYLELLENFNDDE